MTIPPRALLDSIENIFDAGFMGAEIAQVTPLSLRCHDASTLRGGVRAAPPGQPALSPSPTLAGLPVLPALAGLLPGGLPRGTVMTAGGPGLLCLALAAGASAAGAWTAVAGMPRLGVVAAADLGLAPSRLLLVPEPGAGWPQVVASLLDGCEVVLLRPPGQPSAQIRRRLAASLRRSGGVLIVAGDWAGAQARLLVTSQEWTGIGAGHGRLRGRQVRVVADGRGAAARPRTQWLWLPGPDGSVSIADPLAGTGQGRRDAG
jgi:hypothetical protein